MTRKSKVKELMDLLGDLEALTPDIEASAVMSVDGFVIASVLPEDAGRDRAAIISAAMLSLGERAVQELACGELSEVHIKGESGHVVIMASGKTAVLTALARKDADLGLVFSGMKKAAREITEIMCA